MNYLHRSLPIVFSTLFLTPLTAQTVQRGFSVANSIVYATAASEDGSVLFIGGTFTNAGPPVSNLALMNLDSDQPSLDFPRPDGIVNAIEADGVGGWFIAGAFGKVDAMPRARIAHIDASGALTAWAPQMGGVVNCMERVGDTLFVGGSFTTIDGAPRQRLAAFSINTGLLLDWAPTVNSFVESMTVLGGSIYFTGWFSNVGGEAREGLAACSITTGAVLPWNPQMDYAPDQLLATPEAIYFCGGFEQVQGEERRGLAAVDPIDGTVLPWNANITSSVPTVKAMTMDNDALYFTGLFTEVDGVWHPYCAAVDLTTGALLPFNPESPGSLANTIAVVDGNVIVGRMNEKPLMVYNASTGALVDWAPMAFGASTVNAVASQGGAFIVGGEFACIGAQDRDRYAAMDGATGALLQGFPELAGNSSVMCMKVVGDTLFMGGNFSILADVWHQNLVAIHIPTRTVLDWGVSFNGRVDDIDVDDGVVYVAGSFTTAGDQPRGRGAALSLATGELMPWDPVSSHTISSLAAKDGIVYASGPFSNIGGQARERFAALDGITALATPLNVPAEAIPWSMEFGGDTLYLGGTFNALGGIPRMRLGAIDLTTGQVTDWAPEATGTSMVSVIGSEISALAVRNGQVYIGGRFGAINGAPRRAYAVVDAVSGAVTDPEVTFGPNANCQSITTLENLTLVGGAFDNVAQEVRNGAFAIASCDLASYHADADGDGYGNPADAVVQCAADPTPAGYVANANDCNDADEQVWTGGPCELGGTAGIWSSECVCDISTAVYEVSAAGDTWVFPNPFTNEFTIRTSLTGPLDISLFDATGRMVQRERSPVSSGTEHHMTLDVQPGQYFLRLSSPEGIQMVRVMCQ